MTTENKVLEIMRKIGKPTNAGKIIEVSGIEKRMCLKP